MMFVAPRSAPWLALLSASLVVQTSCSDLPTGADAFQLEADGELWTAVLPPADLPTAATWLAFASPSAPGSAAAAAEVEALQAEALRAMIDGDVERTNDLSARAAEAAIRAMDDEPGPGVFLTGIASLETWERSVRDGIDLTRAEALAATVEAVAHDRSEAETALREGDRRAAALHLTRAADRVRAWAPQGVALRVLERVDARLVTAARSPQEARRAAHLVQSARQELIDGQPLRAVQRALYALQVAGGNEVKEDAAADRASCGEFSC